MVGNETMMAVRAHRRGGPELLVYELAPKPEPGPGEILVEVHAAGITYAELTWDLSWTRLDGSDRTPVIPSHEVSGIVVAAGRGVATPKVRDAVYGLVAFDRDGAAAEYVALPAQDVAPKPKSVSHVEAASLPLAALTAWQALVEHAALHAGERVLVHGATGGVGVFVVQLAVSLGAEVTATARAAYHRVALELGAHRVYEFDEPSFENDGHGYDVVVDTVGGGVLERSYEMVRPGGRLVTLGAPPSDRRAHEAGIEAAFFVVRPDRAQLAHLASLVDAGQLRPVVAQEYPLADARLAYAHGPRPRRAGKTVLRVR
jgi:NADPH:quinone reductase-like Zn-dependent oxidoreductase